MKPFNIQRVQHLMAETPVRKNYVMFSQMYNRSKLLLLPVCSRALVLVLVLFPQSSASNENVNCTPSSCGNIREIKYPFLSTGDPGDCGYRSDFTIDCEGNRAIWEPYPYYNNKFYVEAINYKNSTFRVIDPGVHENNLSSLPLYSLDSFYYSINCVGHKNKPLFFLSCPNSVNLALSVTKAPCIPGVIYPLSSSSSANSSNGRQCYVRVGDFNSAELGNSCSIDLMTWTSLVTEDAESPSWPEIHDALSYGFELLFPHMCYDETCQYSLAIYDSIGLPIRITASCGLSDWGNRVFEGRYGGLAMWVQVVAIWTLLLAANALGLLLAIKCVLWVLGILSAVIFLIIKWLRRHQSVFDDIEDYLQSQNNLSPIRYSYSDIKKMTANFKNKLGEGGYGSVYKGKIKSGNHVAIKVLGKSKANGQEFISEVGTIGRIHHVNVVHLIGYCAERSKRALVYDFMPNGSLEKYLISIEEHVPLSCERKFKIALGVAHGIDYLHRGCDMQILHFDIKPHNILLDENFVPKVSDFGLARLYPIDKSIVFLTAARGTIGYVAPELINRSIGGITYKADVYSFGMLLVDLVGLRKNLASIEENSTQYFPGWVYDHLDKGKEIELGDANDDENKITRKLTLVALWCIQTNPANRPSMTRVVGMLEGGVELIQVPPEPFQSPADSIPIPDMAWTEDSTNSTALLGDSFNASTLELT